MFLFQCIALFAQAPEIEWENTIGGTIDDYGYVIRQTFDGGYFIAGTANSNISGDKTANNINGTYDIWVLKLDASGNIEWQKTIGGTNDDGPYGYGGDAEQTSDGGYIVGVSSKSDISGNKTEPCYGGFFYGDYWIIKLDNIGNIEWQNTIGGYGDDRFISIRQTADGGYLAGGYSNSSASYDKIENCLGGYDYWVVKLDTSGNILWQNTIGGGSDDFLTGLTLTSDNGSILTGTSISDISADKNENSIGGYDYWIVKLDSVGNIEWQNDLGGSGFENGCYGVEAEDGGFLIGGVSSSEISGDKTEGNIGEPGPSDFWIIKLDEIGNIEWQNTIGTEQQDQLSAMHISKDNAFIIGGSTTGGFSVDKTEPNYGGYDYWVLKIDSVGNIIWQNTIGGWGADNLTNIEVNADSSVALIGYSNSPASIDKTENYIAEAGYGPHIDYWIVKLSRECHFITYYKDSDADGFGWNDSTMSICDDIPPLGYVANNIDCNDLIGYGEIIYPGATELCNLIDDNCNGLIDDGLPEFTYFADADSDGYGDIFVSIISCQDVPPEGYVTDSTDCNDSNALIHELKLFFADMDGDLFGDSLNAAYFCEIIDPSGYASNNLDCNDADILINPVTNEICNEIDDNCNSEIDEGLSVQTLFVDADYDGYGNNQMYITTCLLEIDGYVSNNLDCDDTNPAIYPGAEETLNGEDDNCNELIDEGLAIENTLLSEIKIYPNPANDILHIDYSGNEMGAIQILNIDGENIYSNKLAAHLTINIQNFPKGIYLLKIISNGNQGVFNFVKA